MVELHVLSEGLLLNFFDAIISDLSKYPQKYPGMYPTDSYVGQSTILWLKMYMILFDSAILT